MLASSGLVEVSQLDHAPWIDSIRRTMPGGLILGFEFVWRACYVVGVGLGILIERIDRLDRSAPGGEMMLSVLEPAT